MVWVQTLGDDDTRQRRIERRHWHHFVIGQQLRSCKVGNQMELEVSGSCYRVALFHKPIGLVSVAIMRGPGNGSQMAFVVTCTVA